MCSKDESLGDNAAAHLRRARQYVQDWCGKHQWAVGIGEMALGAGLLAAGIQSGVIEVGIDLVGVVLGDDVMTKIAGGLGGSFLGTGPAAILGSIGIAGLGSAIAVPAIALMGGGALLLGLAGYGATSLVLDFLKPSLGMAEAMGGGCLLVGVALLVDGARRLVTDEAVRRRASELKDGVLHFVTVSASRFLTNLQDLTKYLVDGVGAFFAELGKEPAGVGASAATAGAGAVAGSAFAASTVTVLGSSTLGGAALSLGLVSAPLWPVIVGGAAGAAVGYAAWKVVKRAGRKRKRGGEGNPLLLPAPDPRRDTTPDTEPDA